MKSDTHMFAKTETKLMLAVPLLLWGFFWGEICQFVDVQVSLAIGQLSGALALIFFAVLGKSAMDEIKRKRNNNLQIKDVNG